MIGVIKSAIEVRVGIIILLGSLPCLNKKIALMKHIMKKRQNNNAVVNNKMKIYKTGWRIESEPEGLINILKILKKIADKIPVINNEMKLFLKVADL